MTPSGNPNQSVCTHCGLPVAQSPRPSEPDGLQFCCLGCRLVHGLASAGDESANGRPPDTLLLRIGLGVFLAMNLMVFNWFFYSRHVFDVDVSAAEQGQYDTLAGLFAYVLMLICTLVIALLGLPILHAAITSRRRRLDVQTLILIGVFAAFAVSVWHTLRGHGALYFDTAAMILVLVTFGMWLDTRAKRNVTDSASGLRDLLPVQSTTEHEGAQRQVQTCDLNVADTVRVACGDAIPVDGVVVSGRSHVASAMLTGEAQPTPVGPGDRVLAGAVNVDGLLRVRATAVGEDTALGQMEHLLREARLTQPAIQRLADRVAAVFVPAVLVLAVLAGIWHGSRHGEGVGVMTALSVLLISCPCALGLAAPLATWRAMNRAARRGILFSGGDTLEKAARVQHVLFDKTGTLTGAALRVEQIDTFEDFDEDRVLVIASSLGAASRHPVASALSDESDRRGLGSVEVASASLVPGQGIEGRVADDDYRLGSRPFVFRELADASPQTDLATSEDGDVSCVWLSRNGRLIALFKLGEELRPDTGSTLASVKAVGLSCEVLTGDRSAVAARLGEQLGVTVTGELLPADKVERVRLAKEHHRVVAFVGDGANDAPALATADVGIAVQGATDLAKQAGNIVVVGNGLGLTPVALAIARDTLRRIRLNLTWAFGYNTVGLTLAALGWLNPVIAAVFMVASSLMIVSTSARAGERAAGRTPEANPSDASTESHASNPRAQPVPAVVPAGVEL